MNSTDDTNEHGYVCQRIIFYQQMKRIKQILRVALPSLPSGWRNEVFRGLTKCQAMPSEGSAVLCTTGENASETSVIREISAHPWEIRNMR